MAGGQEKLTLITIPYDLHVEILSFIPVRQLLSYARCCKQSKVATEDDRLWFPGTAIHIATGDSVPAARLCHSVVLNNKKLYIYGGDASRDPDKIDNVKGDLWSFNFEGGKWTECPVNGTKPILTEQSAVLHNGKMCLFGGNSGSTTVTVANILANNLNLIDLSSYDMKEIKPATSNFTPPRRSAHTAVVYENKMYIFGGWDGKKSFGDFYSYDFEMGKWETVTSSGTPPSERRAHCAVVHDHYLYIFGGYANGKPSSTFNKMHQFDFHTGAWELFHGTGDIPRGRSRADMVVYKDKIYLVGGFDRDSKDYFADLYEFNTQTHQWRALKSNLESLTEGICQHKSVVYNGWLVIFGGFSSKESSSHNRLYAINLRRKAK